MKRIISVILVSLLTLSLTFCLTGCGGADKQPLADSYNKAIVYYNDLANLVNSNLDYIDQATVDAFNEIGTTLELYKSKLDSDEELTQEQVDNAIKWLDNDLTEYCKSAKQEIETQLAEINK